MEKYKEIQLTKNKMDFNNRIMKNHPLLVFELGRWKYFNKINTQNSLKGWIEQYKYNFKM